MDALDDTTASAVRDVRFRFLDQVAPLRPDLYRYCRSLTGSAWDAEDLVQDTLLKAFAKLGEAHGGGLSHPRAFLLRVATNLFLNQRRREPHQALLSETEAPPDPAALAPEVREALSFLIAALPPRARAAVLLFDVFGLTLKETARAMDTTLGAVKAALHRGRRRLDESRGDPPLVLPVEPARASQQLERFVAAFNARDLDALAALLEEDAEAEVVGIVFEQGRAAIRDGSLHHTLFDEAGDPRAELGSFEGEAVVLLWYLVEGERRLGDVLRFAEDEGGLRSLRYYYFCPEFLAEVAERLRHPVHLNGYRYPTPGPDAETA